MNLLREAERGLAAARIYTWESAWVTIGMHQDPATSLRRQDIPFIVRPTGGRGVLHGHDVTLGLAVPLADLGDPSVLLRSLRTVYRLVILPVVAALNDCGIPAALGEDTRFASLGQRSADCFSHVGSNDVVHIETGQKLCGCALRMTDRAVLLQASIPVAKPLIDPTLVFFGPTQNHWISLDAKSLYSSLGKAVL